MNGVRRFLGGGTPASSSPPTTPAADVSPLAISGKSSWPSTSVQRLPDSPSGSPKISNQMSLARNDRQRSMQPGEEISGNMTNQANLPVNGTSSIPSTRSQISFASSSSHPLWPNSPVAGVSSSRTSPQSRLLSRKSVNSRDSDGKSLMNARDELLISLLASEAVVDSQGFEMLSAEEVEDLKKASSIEHLTSSLI